LKIWLVAITLRIVFPQAGIEVSLPCGEEPVIVPLAIPMIAGPSALAASIA